MKHFGWVVLLVLLVGCGKDGDDGTATMTFDADAAIVAVDFSDIGAKAEGGFYYPNKVYSLSLGPGLILWTDGITVWFADVDIEPGTQGEDAPLEGLLLQDGDDGRGRRYEWYLALGFYFEDDYLLSATLDLPQNGLPSPEELYPIRRLPPQK